MAFGSSPRRAHINGYALRLEVERRSCGIKNELDRSLFRMICVSEAPVCCRFFGPEYPIDSIAMSLSRFQGPFLFESFSRASLNTRKDKLRNVFETPASFLEGSLSENILEPLHHDGGNFSTQFIA